MKKLLCILLTLTLLMCSATALAKTTSEAIEAPADDAVVFTISDEATTVEFTWADITGAGAYELTKQEYPAKVDGAQTLVAWEGVLLRDLITAAMEKGVILPEDAMLEAVSADGFAVSFTLADAMAEENLFLVAADPVKNYDGDTVYDNSFVRILRDADAANQANIRCVTGLKLASAAAE